MRATVVRWLLVLLVLSTPTATRAQNPESAKLSGTVLDVSGGAVSGADITLTETGESATRSGVAGPDGTFTFENVPAGSYVLIVNAPGFQEYRSETFRLTASQALQIPTIVLSIATVSTSVVVQPTDVIAAEQIKAEEQQRVFAVLPDFYTSYVWNAAPLTTKHKFSLALRTAFDPVSLLGTSLGAGIEQATNVYPGFGRGADGYAKRWGALFADGRTRELLNRAVFPSLFHQDPRYFYQGSGSTWSRIRHAVGYAFVARSDSGHLIPNYSSLLGGIASGAVSNLYYPSSSRGAGLIVASAVIGLAGRAGQNLMREFVFRHLTKHVSGEGKPAASNDHP